MTKFSLEKKRNSQRVKEGYSIAQVARETGISEEVIRNVLHHRATWMGSIEPTSVRLESRRKFSILQHMKKTIGVVQKRAYNMVSRQFNGMELG